MKIKRLLVILMLLLLPGCYSPAVAPPDEDAVRTVRIGVCLYWQDDFFVGMIMDSMIEAAKQLEQAENIKLVLTTKDAQHSQNLQNEQVAAFLEKGYDAVLVNVVDRTAVAGLIDRAKSAGIPILFFNREPVQEDLDRWSKVYYIGADAAESGRLQGGILVDAWNENPALLDRNGDGKLQYVMLEGDAGHQDSLLRTETVIQTLADAGIKTDKLASGIANWQRVQASTKMALWIEKFGAQIEVVIANNDDMALGALDALDNAHLRPQPAVVGIDGIPPALTAVTERRMLGTVSNDADGQAQAAIGIAYALITNGDLTAFPLDGKYLRLPYTQVS